MPALGSLTFIRWDGPPPPTPAPSVETFEVAGQPYLGARVHPYRSTTATVTLTSYVVLGAAAPLIPNYNAAIGTSLAALHGGVLYSDSPYSILHFVQDMRVQSVRRLIRARGVWDDGSRFDFAPAEEVVSRWTLRPVPAPPPAA